MSYESVVHPDTIRKILRAPDLCADDLPPEWVERARGERRRLTLARVGATAGIVSLVVLLGTLARHAFLGDALEIKTTRASLALVVWLSGCAWASRGPCTGTRARWLTVALLAGVIVECCWVIHHTGGLASMSWPSLILVLLGSPLLFPLSLGESALLAAGVWVGFGIAVWAAGVADPVLLVDRAIWLGQASFVCMAAAHLTTLLRRREARARFGMEEEQRRTEDLILNILPGQVAARLKSGENQIADGHEQVSVLFADIVGFTPMSATKTAAELVAILDRLFSAFDRLAVEHGLEKIKTIGDCYMVASGLPVGRADHADAAARMAIGMLRVIREFNAETGERLDVRVGMHCGPVVAGVIGENKFAYDLWGDTVNLASRMESHGVPGEVQVSAAFKDALGPAFSCRARGEVALKGKGTLPTYLLDQPAPGGAA